MKNIAKQLRIILLSALVLGAFASASRAAEDYPLHVIVSLTGTGAFIGQGEKRTLELLQVSVNQHGGIEGRPVSFVFHDDQTNPQVAVQIVTELVTHCRNAETAAALVSGSA